MKKTYYRHSYIQRKKEAMDQYKKLMLIALANKNRNIFLKYNALYEQMQFEFSQALTN